jgi:hypothetical protein
MSTEPATPTPAVNADQVTPAVIRRLLVTLLASALAAWGLDSQLSGPLADILMWAVPAVLGIIGAWWGSRDAKQRVTPTSKYGTPRDHDGVELVRAVHDTTTGYPRPRVDRRGVDRDPDRP